MIFNQKEISFNKFTLPDSPNIYKVYGDNIEESINIIKLLGKFNSDKMKFISLEYISLSEFVYIYEISGDLYYFVALAYYRNGALPYEVRKCIRVLDKPDAVIYSLKDDKVLMGFESTETGFIGNASWQRTGRIINFAEREYPFGYLGFYSKLDQSRGNIREPSYLFVLMFNLLSLKYSTHIMVGLSEHPDSSHWQDKINPKKDMRKPIFNYLYSIITGTNGDIYLEESFRNMKEYYFSKEKIKRTDKEFGTSSLQYLRDINFEKQIIEDISKSANPPLFIKSNLLIKFNTKKNVDLSELFPEVSFLALSKNASAGITFETQKLISILNEKTGLYTEDLIDNRLNAPTIIIPTNMTKTVDGNLVFTDDPYNGEIIAFTNMYKQSFPDANVLLILCDHSNAKEYDVGSAKGHKIYKAIDKYADILMDADYNLFSTESEKFRVESRSRYENTYVTEDDVTSFFGTLLDKYNIPISFLNPPSGSWSDIHLYPTDKYYYLKRNDKRGDIAFYSDASKTYYVGESKQNYANFKNNLSNEYLKTNNLAKIIKKELENEIQFETKTFIIFKGSESEAKELLGKSKYDYAVIIDDSDKITIRIIN